MPFSLKINQVLIFENIRKPCLNKTTLRRCFILVLIQHTCNSWRGKHWISNREHKKKKDLDILVWKEVERFLNNAYFSLTLFECLQALPKYYVDTFLSKLLIEYALILFAKIVSYVYFINTNKISTFLSRCFFQQF